MSLLSPAKSLDFERPLATKKATEPRFLDQSQELIDVLRTKSLADVAGLMNISDELAALNAERYQSFDPPFTKRNARAALLAFDGDAYRGMNPSETFDERDFTEAQKSLRILSGLYGLLRPLDLIQPYRLEMGIALENPRGRDLYAFWGDQLTRQLKADLADSPGAEVVINLASQEYAKAIDFDALGVRVISPRFEQISPTGQRRMVSFSAKRARGQMVGWLIQQRARSASVIKNFDVDGYRYDAAASSPDVPVFVNCGGR